MAKNSDISSTASTDQPTVKASSPPSPVANGGAPTPQAGSSSTQTSTATDTSSTPDKQSDSSAGTTIQQRKGQYLVAARRSIGMQTLGLQPLQFNVIEQALRSSPDIEILDTVGPKKSLGALANGMDDSAAILVVKMSDQKAVQLQQQGQGRLIVERDQTLVMSDASLQRPTLVACSQPSTGASLNVPFKVIGANQVPLANAEVCLFGSLLPVVGTTDAQGEVHLSLYGETPQSIRGLYVKPKADYWSFYQTEPDISIDALNVVALRALSEWPGLANFPQRQAFGWGQKMMRLDRLPVQYRGQGVRVAVIDSGADNGHGDLQQIHFGLDIINKKLTPNTWNVDTISHGSHCAGVIAGADNGFGIRGFAPDAEVHVCKLFPGGQISQLIDALEYCIEKQLDVVNLSLGGAEPSEALDQQIQRAKRAGIACIVAAGNSGGAVQYPAASPDVLAVAAVGRLNEFPQDSYHSQTLMAAPVIDSNGFFSPTFTCFGPQIAVCAPGVAITSSVPPNGYAVWDGTSMAAPHITGLAALVLAHHPDFQAGYKLRNADRVERLFQIIKASAQPLRLGDPQRTGFGLPDVIIAVGLQAPMGMPQSFSVAPPRSSISGPGQPTSGASMQTAAFSPASLDPMASAFGGQWPPFSTPSGLPGMPGFIDPTLGRYAGGWFGQGYPGLQLGLGQALLNQRGWQGY